MVRRIYIAAVMLLVAVACFFAYRQFHLSALADLREIIQRRYAATIAEVERQSQQLNNVPGDDYETVRQVTARLSEYFQTDEVYWASWSLDGHHGLDGLKSTGDGISFSEHLLSETADNRYSLCYGWARTSGDPLLVFQGYIPEGTKQHFLIAFRRSDILAIDE